MSLSTNIDDEGIWYEVINSGAGWETRAYLDVTITVMKEAK